MADPSTALAAASIGSTLLGGIMGGMGASQSATANAKAFQYKAGIAGLNQTIAKQNAAWALNAGDLKAANFGMKAGQEIAETKVVQAASGLDVNSGTRAAVRESQTDVAKYDQEMIRADASHTAHGYEVEAAKFGAEAKLDLAASDDAMAAGKLGILSSIIGTAGSVASKWTQASTIGIGSGGGPIGTYDPSNYGAAPSWSS